VDQFQVVGVTPKKILVTAVKINVSKEGIQSN
jgi:hypothetical protein